MYEGGILRVRAYGFLLQIPDSTVAQAWADNVAGKVEVEEDTLHTSAACSDSEPIGAVESRRQAPIYIVKQPYRKCMYSQRSDVHA